MGERGKEDLDQKMNIVFGLEEKISIKKENIKIFVHIILIIFQLGLVAGPPGP